jgi:hypothetical protein
LSPGLFAVDLAADTTMSSVASERHGDSRRRSSVGSTCSDWFNTTREEMILYEKFGEDYDVVRQ